MKTNRHRVLVSDPYVKSHAAAVLLVRMYRKLGLQEYLNFRDEVLDEAEARDGRLKCTYCPRDNLLRDVPADAVKQPRNLATIDHVVPVSKGGRLYDKKNVVVACYSCNQNKKDKCG